MLSFQIFRSRFFIEDYVRIMTQVDSGMTGFNQIPARDYS